MRQGSVIAAGMALALLTQAASAQDFDLDALLAAAKSEPPTSVYAVTGKIVGTAEAFSAKYGLNVTGKKVNEAGQIDLLIREGEAGNVAGSVSLASDASLIAGELIAQGLVESYLPADIAPHIAPANQNPLVVVNDPHVWAYNSDSHDTCPVSNVWQLTEPEWSGQVAFMDPLDTPPYADMFNQLAMGHDDKMAAAYEAHFGKPFDTGQGSATEAWVKAFAANRPLVASSDNASEAIGTKEQEKTFVGMLSVAKFRDNAGKGYALKICEGMQPFPGWLYPGVAVIASGTKSPATAKLFVHFLLTDEGISNQTIDGKVPSDTRLSLPAEEASGVGALLDQLMVWDLTQAAADLEARQDWQDLWMMNLKR